MSQPDHPLPECLTRLLAAPPAHAVPPTPGDRPRARPPRRTAGAGDRATDRATDGAIIRGTVFGVAGLVWVGILWQVLHRLSG